MTRLAPVLALALAGVFFAEGASARIEIPAKVRYEARSGESDWATTQVTFMSGEELNTATRTLSYNSFGHYAIIFFSQHQAAVIELAGFYACTVFDTNCLPVLGNMHGTDKEEREWTICTHYMC